jgi:hypothetical protein
MPITNWTAPRSPALAAQVALLQYLLEEVGADQLIQHMLLRDFSLRAFQLLLYPTPPFRVRDVDKLNAHRAAIDTASLVGGLAFELQLCLGCGGE